MIVLTASPKGGASSVQSSNSKKLELLQQRINDEDYLHSAIQRLALVLSNELMGITKEGRRYEQQKRRK